MNVNRRDLLKLGSFITLGAASAVLPSLDVQKPTDWEPVPNFGNGHALTSEQLNALTVAIVQLQKEVEYLRNGQPDKMFMRRG